MRVLYPLLLLVMLGVATVNWRVIRRFGLAVTAQQRHWYMGINGLGLAATAYGWLQLRFGSGDQLHVRLLIYAAVIWMISSILVMAGLVLLAVLRRLPTSRKLLSRRQFFKKTLYALYGAATALSLQGMYNSVRDITVNRLEITIEQLPPGLKGLKILQISDVHLGAFFSLEKLENTLTLAIEQKPDVVVITGDLLDDLDLLAGAVAALNRLAAAVPGGVYFCWGNHEYFRDITVIRRALYQSAVKVLANSHDRLEIRGNHLYFLGVDYPWADNGTLQKEKQQRFLAEAQQGIPKGQCQVLLTHHPDFIDNAFGAQIPLTLAGHTHGGQINIAGWPLLPVRYRYMRGLYRQGDSQAYVNVGAGQWFPWRLGCPAEITLFTLT